MMITQAARLAGQEDPARFMEKVMQACAKFYVPPALPDLPPLPPMPGGMPVSPLPADMLASSSAPSGGASPSQQSSGQRGGGGGGLILPGEYQDIKGPKGRPPAAPGGGSGLIIPGR